MAHVDQFVTFLHTRDLERSADFYERRLGLRLARDQGDCRIYHVGGAAYLGVCLRPGAPQAPGGVVLTLVTDAVDEWHQRLSAQGVVFERAPALNERYGIYHCFLRDPDGYLLEIQQFLEPLD